MTIRLITALEKAFGRTAQQKVVGDATHVQFAAGDAAEIKSATEEAKTLPVAGSSTSGIIAHLDEIFLNLGRDIHKDESTLVAYSTEKWAELKDAIWPAKKEVVEAAKNTDTTATDKVAADTNTGEPIPSVAPVGSVPEPGETVDETHLPQD
jgi:hypothetical protein